ncbi:MAG: Ig-like domain-containing protein [Polyangiaceae bacterium]
MNGAGVTAIATAVLVGGTHTIVADYGGDTNHDPASGSVIQTVALASSSTSLVSLTNPSVFGQAVQLSATVTGVSGGATPTGTVTFLDGTTAIGFGVLNGAGQATFSTSALSASAHTLTARYGADSNYVSSDSPPLSQQVNRAGTTTSLASSANPSALGASVTFTANVSATAPGSGVPVGNVTFRDGATVLGTVATDASGQATFTTSALILGGHSIRASYGGSSSFNASNSAFLTQEISVRPVTVTVTSSGTPSAYGSSVTFEATVASGGATPTGTVTFTEGVILLGTTTLDGSGKGSIAVGTLSGGSHSITATYSGDAEHAGGSSGAFVQVVSRAPTASVITSSVNPSVSGQSVVFTATVTSPVSGSITGTVTFSDGSTILGARALDASGVATFTTSQLSVGAHSIVASFDGDTNFGASTSMAYVQTVGKASSRVVLSSSASPVNGGDTVTYTASVASVLPGSGVPSGTVTFTDTFGGSTTTLGTGTVDSLGVASYVAMPDSGTHVIGARYEGDASFLASDATTITQEVVANASTVALVLSPTPSTFGDTVTWSVTVTGSSPSGALTFKDGTTVLGTGTLDSSSAATFTTSALGGGVHTLVVEYGGDTANAAGTRSVQHTVQRAPTTTTVASAPNPSTFGSAVTVTAEVSSAVLGLTGQVEIFDGMLSLGTAALASGRATLTTSTLTVGGHALSVRYEGTSDFAPSTSMATTQQVDDAVDGGVTDGGTVDGGSSDGGISDGGSTDGGTLDGSVVLPDATVPDAGDGGRTDAGSDAGDTGRTDGGADASSGDAGRDSAAPNDAAVLSDADAPRPDSGVIVVDASASDSGIPNGSGVEGAGGCNCRVQGTTLSGNDPMFASAGVVFGLAVMARRRRRAA